MTVRPSTISLAAVLVALALHASFASSDRLLADHAPAGGQTFTVDSTADTVDADPGDGVCADAAGDCTLRAAVMEANALPGTQTIELPAGTYTLTIPGAGEDFAETGDLNIRGSLTIIGAGPGSTIIEAPPNDRVFDVPLQVSSATRVIEISDLTVRYGDETGALGGGAIRALQPVELTLTRVAVEDNSSTGMGGGIVAVGEDTRVTVVDSTISGNETLGIGGGLGVRIGASVTIVNSMISGNSASAGAGIGTEGIAAVSVNGGEISENVAEHTGGGLLVNNPGAMVDLADVVFTGNEAGRGGGIGNFGSITLTDTTITAHEAQIEGGGIFNGVSGMAFIYGGEISDNDAILFTGGGIHNAAGGVVQTSGALIQGNGAATSGGGIFNAADLEVMDTMISGNTAGSPGGGLYNASSAEIAGSTFSANETGDSGGGLFNSQDGILSIANSTLSGNTAEINGGGIHNSGQARFAFSTITANAADGGTGNGIFNPDGFVELRTTIVAANPDVNCAGFSTYESNGYNLSDDATCSLTDPTDLPDTDPVLGALAGNGGPTLTHALLFGSPALDGGPVTCTGTPADQRGLPRPQGGACDIGAYEGAHLLWADADCDGAVAIGDAVKTARHLLGLSVSQTEPCFTLDAAVTADGSPRSWGDVDCEGTVVIGDALKIARWLLSLSVSQEPACPEIGLPTLVLPQN